jgi:hypothetical protein
MNLNPAWTRSFSVVPALPAAGLIVQAGAEIERSIWLRQISF